MLLDVNIELFDY